MEMSRVPILCAGRYLGHAIDGAVIQEILLHTAPSIPVFDQDGQRIGSAGRFAYRDRAIVAELEMNPGMSAVGPHTRIAVNIVVSAPCHDPKMALAAITIFNEPPPDGTTARPIPGYPAPDHLIHAAAAPVP